jgi:hypothetical protein
MRREARPTNGPGSCVGEQVTRFVLVHTGNTTVIKVEGIGPVLYLQMRETVSAFLLG